MECKTARESKSSGSCDKNHRIFYAVLSLLALVTCTTFVLHETRVGKLQNEIVQIKLEYKHDMETIAQKFANIKANCLSGKIVYN